MRLENFVWSEMNMLMVRWKICVRMSYIHLKTFGYGTLMVSQAYNVLYKK